MKAFLTLFSLPIFSFFANAQAPTNDNCAGLVNLGTVPYCSSPAQYTNVNATTSVIDVPGANVPACFNNSADRDVWFQFTLPADGSIVDIEISVYGNVGGNGTMQMPQVAIYRGTCTFGELAELDCAAAPLNVNEVHLQQFGLTPGIPYFLRINDYSATAAANAGTFKLCVEKYVPEIVMGTVASTGSCTGTLWDSGGPDADYSDNESLAFTICPQESHQCIILNVEDYQTENGYDYLRFYQGDDIGGFQLTQITGIGSNFEVQIPAPCATIQFDSDGSNIEAGFKITWTCSPSPCTTPPPTTCSDPDVIPGLPFAENNLSNCFSGNSINSGPCDDAEFLFGNDYIFTYTSPGDECVKIATTGTNIGAGIGVYDQCPSLPGANCIASVGNDFGIADPVVGAAFLENPGTYYIVFGAGANCSPFNITVDTVTCPVVLPSASNCDQALNISGCSNELPEIIALTPGAGDPNFIQPGINQGCLVSPQSNYSFFYFEAGSNGKFGFTVEAADPSMELEDIDFNVWGPIDEAADICDFVSNNQPVRSSWTGPVFPQTGMADTHPLLQTSVLDDFDCGSPGTPSPDGDAFVRRLDVEAGKIYVVMLDDFSSVITDGGIAIDFSGTTDGVLNAPQDAVSVSADTSVCAGQPVQLSATGGAAYFWSADNSLSCTNCQNPVATPAQSTNYQVQVLTACETVTRTVKVKTIELDLGPDVTVCSNATFTLNPNGYQDADYVWAGPPGLSCYNCPSPQVSGLTTGVYTYVATLTTPLCNSTDTIVITVVNGQQPQYNIANDTTICLGQSVSLGGAGFPLTNYQWTSSPVGYTASGANPLPVMPTVTTKYFLIAFSPSSNCPFVSIDSILVTVALPPVLQMQPDTAICNGESVLLATTQPEPGVTYTWTPNNGTLDNVNSATPLATPLQASTIYQLTAEKSVCKITRSVKVDVVTFDLLLNVGDTAICKGTPLDIQATLIPAQPNLIVEWNPTDGLQIGPNGLNVIASPEVATFYIASASVPGCTRTDSILVDVDSLPQTLAIMPLDTMICKGAQVQLVTKPIPPTGQFPTTSMEYLWTPAAGQLTPDSLLNMVVQPDTTTTYQRVTTNGVCVSIDTARVEVIEPPEMYVLPADTLICPGRSVQLQLYIETPGVTGIMWSPPDGLSCFEECYNPVATPGSTMTYTVMGEFKGCPTSTSTTVQVSPLPPIQFPSNTDVCEGEPVTLNAAYDPLSNYTWTSTDPSFVPSQNPTVTPTLPVTTYSVSATNAIGCTNQGSVVLKVTPKPTLTVDGDTTICQNISTQLTAAGSQPGTYIWNTGQTGQNITVTPASTTIYTVIYTPANSVCPPITGTVTVEVDGMAPNIAFPNDKELCPGESVILNSAPAPGPTATYSWVANPPGAAPIPNVAIPPAQTPSQSTQYTVTATLDQCTTTQTLSVIVYNATLTLPDDVALCAGEVARIAANGSLSGSYDWSSGDTTALIEVSPTVNTTYDLIYTYGDGCILTGSVDVTVVPNFALAIEAEPDTNKINVGEPIELTAIVSPSQNLTNFQFVWTENGQENVGNTETIAVTPTGNETSVFYTLVATAPNGCSQEARIEFTLAQPVVVVPNAFTPNGDGINDVFRLKVIEGSINLLGMDIYNRWGKKVFSSTDPDAAWDGKMDDGKEAPSDVYVYFIRWERGDGALQPPFKGDIALLR